MAVSDVGLDRQDVHARVRTPAAGRPRRKLGGPAFWAKPKSVKRSITATDAGGPLGAAAGATYIGRAGDTAFMDFDALVTATTAFVQAHQAWAGPIVAILAFCELLAFVSLLVPATVILIAIGALLGASGLGIWSATFWIVCLCGALGAVMGDWLSYEVGRYYHVGIKRVWPLNRGPQLVAKAESFIQRWGVWGVFLGRFSGPLRALVPIVAGIFDMPRLRFQAANVASGAVWSFGLLAPGAGALEWLG